MATSTSTAAKKAIRNPGGTGSTSGRKDSSGGGSSNPTVKFARRTSSGRYVSLSRDEIDLSGSSPGTT
ncbi:hypothetical protein HPP92_002593 [Vanilla planifolia]|uniref:Uncharacterized protein n=1 Tax=Vanilla planifolia TaxID=51239 RepID=A0A835S230_VANPL|nr:hypothetical protein HPP92_002983 [Vanilla planifolia]KAG0502521.1 hypothetical protein HPP92_002593 [Vanilla planifolia]